MIEKIEDAPVGLVDAHDHRETPLAPAREVFDGLFGVGVDGRKRRQNKRYSLSWRRETSGHEDYAPSWNDREGGGMGSSALTVFEIGCGPSQASQAQCLVVALLGQKY